MRVVPRKRLSSRSGAKGFLFLRRRPPMMTRTKYRPAEIEGKWQADWDNQGLYYARDDSSRPNYYNLVMLPYPSGDLHIGHWYNYTGIDVHGRFMRMRGCNVSQPMGFDAFGLP